MPVKLKIRKGDRVVVLTGRDKGKAGQVLNVIPSENRAIVQGVNVGRRHQKQTASQDGGIVAKEMPINISNLALADPRTGKPTKVGYKFLSDGKKVRFAKRSGEVIDG
jgi:large subunit ribosomal protein L24